MIYRVYSDLATFKSLNFQSGLNILLADRTPEATEYQTRNGAGKTSFIEILHFLLGANVDKESLFRKRELESYIFGMEFDLAGVRTIVERSTKNSKVVHIVQGDPTNWPIRPKDVDLESGNWKVSNTNWRTILGSLIFQIPANTDVANEKFGPTFRSLISYFIRRQANEGFISPDMHFRIQSLYDRQVAISYLLGLDWTIPQQWEVIRQRERTLVELRRKASSGEDEVLASILGNSAELRTQLVVAEEEAQRIGTNLEGFQVLPEYEELEIEANNLTRELSGLSDSNTIDRQLVSDLELSLGQEKIPSIGDLEGLYSEAGIILPEALVQRFEDVQRFHESVIRNRQSYLQNELNGARQRIGDREARMRSLDQRRSEIMIILNTHGALRQFSMLSSELSKAQAKAEVLRQRFESAQQLEQTITELQLARAQLTLRLQQDFVEQSEALNQAILAFEQVSNSLYESAGRFEIKPTQNGPEFNVSIQGEKSKGISNMQIFCFDMMLMKIMGNRQMGPGFLVHDSHLFDGVDERQIYNALKMGAQFSEEMNFQYIVTMNSDALPKEEGQTNFRIEDHLLDIRLTDQTDTGGLFGFRFA